MQKAVHQAPRKADPAGTSPKQAKPWAWMAPWAVVGHEDYDARVSKSLLCLFIDIEYFYVRQFLWISGVNELYKIHISFSFLFHENVTFSRLQILNFAFLVAQYEKNMACIMKTRNLMAWDVLRYDERIWKIICVGAIAFDDWSCALLLVHKQASWRHSLNYAPGGRKSWNSGIKGSW